MSADHLWFCLQDLHEILGVCLLRQSMLVIECSELGKCFNMRGLAAVNVELFSTSLFLDNDTNSERPLLAGVSTWGCVSKTTCLNWMICSCRCALWFFFLKIYFSLFNPRQRNLLIKQFWSFIRGVLMKTYRTRRFSMCSASTETVQNHQWRIQLLQRKQLCQNKHEFTFPV